MLDYIRMDRHGMLCQFYIYKCYSCYILTYICVQRVCVADVVVHLFVPQINEQILFWVLGIFLGTVLGARNKGICPHGVCTLMGQTLSRYVYFRWWFVLFRENPAGRREWAKCMIISLSKKRSGLHSDLVLIFVFEVVLKTCIGPEAFIFSKICLGKNCKFMRIIKGFKRLLVKCSFLFYMQSV